MDGRFSELDRFNGDVGRSPTPQSSPFLWGQRNGLETQRKPLGPGGCCWLGSYIISTGIEFGRVVDGKVSCVHLAWPLTLDIVEKMRPTVLSWEDSRAQN